MMKVNTRFTLCAQLRVHTYVGTYIDVYTDEGTLIVHGSNLTLL